MKSMTNLWWLGVVAAVAACDPYDDERGGQPEILSVLASGGDSDGAIDFFDAEPNASGVYEVTSTSTCTPEETDDPATPADESAPEATLADASVIYVKLNKLLDGASIQATPDSCAPANGWLRATKNGVDDTANWFSCYSPSTATDVEGASIVLYRGANVTTGPGGDGWYVQSDSAAKDAVSVYTVQGQVADKAGNAIPISIAYTVEPDAGPVEPTVTAATGEITWDPAGCGTATAYNVYKQDVTDAGDPVDEEPVLLTATPIAGTTFTDTTPAPVAPAAARTYFIAPLVGTVETKPQGPFDESTNP